jgi:pectate lyase
VTVSYNRFALHEKNTLVGSSDGATGDAGKLRVTFSNNLFDHVSARAPRVRFGQVHLYNNYHVGDRHHPAYGHEYSIGMGKRGDVIGDANVYEIAGARGCSDVVRTWSTESSFSDHGSLLNGAPLAGCTHPSAPAWQVPYPFRALPASKVRQHVLANAGAGYVEALDIAVAPAFVKPTHTLRAELIPAAGARDVPPDSPLRITFARPPVLSASGSVRIYTKREGTLVDVIHPVETIVAIGTGGQIRHVRMNPVKVKGNTVTIFPRSGALRNGTEYEVVIGTGIIEGHTGRWSFRTRKAPPSGATLTVDDDGPADFRTVQGALNHAMERFPRQAPVTVAVRNGDYEELLYVRGRDKLTIRGQSRAGVVIHATNNEGLHAGADRALLLIEDADLFTLDTLTLRNDTERRHSRPGQAETILFNSPNGRLIARNANFISEQDTLQLRGYAWFYNTLVAGNVDFIWGSSRAALFERSEIRSVGDSSNADNGGYLVQARTDTAAAKGFVFLNSTLTHGKGPAGNDVPAGRTWLARSPGTASTWDNVAFIGCRMDQHIALAGWAGSGVPREPVPNPAQATVTSGWRESGSMALQGRPLDLTQRRGALVMDKESARVQFGTRAIVFSDFDGGKGWDPLTETGTAP